jgi:hypothetical protein
VVCQGRCSYVIVENEGGPPIAVKRRVVLQLLEERSCGVGGETERRGKSRRGELGKEDDAACEGSK